MRKISLPEAIGVPYAAEMLSRCSSINSESTFRPTTISEDWMRDSTFRDRETGVNLGKSRECDSISRQFIEIDFN